LPETLHFGKFEFDLRQRQLTRPEGDVPLNLKSAEVLAYLVQRPQQIVAKDELIRAVWNETAVTEDALEQRIRVSRPGIVQLRRVAGGSRCILAAGNPTHREGLLRISIQNPGSAAAAVEHVFEFPAGGYAGRPQVRSL
jgi:hypothetical protein